MRTVAKTSESTTTAKASTVTKNTPVPSREPSSSFDEDVFVEDTASVEILISQCGPSQPSLHIHPEWLNKKRQIHKGWV
jgi:hypothetical protein